MVALIAAHCPHSWWRSDLCKYQRFFKQQRFLERQPNPHGRFLIEEKNTQVLIFLKLCNCNSCKYNYE